MRRTFSLLGAAALVAAVVTQAGSGGDPWKNAARYEFEYRVRLSEIGAKGERVSLWVPYPAENLDQKILEAKIDSPWSWRLTREEKFGNRMIYAEGAADPSLADLAMRFVVEREPSAGIPPDAASAEATLRPALYKMPDRLIPLAGAIRKIAEQEARGRQNEPEKVRAFYDYVYRTMTYNKDGTGWGRGDAIWACHNKRGNCTDFHSLFIGMLRTEGIPARFLIGFPIPEGDDGPVAGYHCWAEFYDEQRGWLPVDASEAKKKGLQEAYFGSLPNDRIEFTAGRDIVLSPPQKGDPLNYFIYPYGEIGGKPAPQPKTGFRFKRLTPPVSS